MSRYIQQSTMTLPSEGSNTIHHFVKTFINDDTGLLDIEINAWFSSLEDLVSSPIIQSVSYQTVDDPPTITHTAFIHYILVV